MSFACVHIPNFPVQAVARNEPELRFRGVVITEGKSETVMAANKAARDAGVQVGMIRLQVSQLPGIEIRLRSPAQEAVAHAALLDLSFVFSPRVEDTAADAITLDLDGLERVCGPADDIAKKIVQQAAELGLEVNVAIASNPDASLHAARGFTGITLIDSAATAERLGPLPVNLLAPPEEILETLNRWGIRTFKALAGLPTAELSERLGQPGVQLQKLARGAGLRPLIPVQPSLHFEEVMELEYAEEELEPLSFILGRLLGQLCVRLAARGLAAQELRLVLDLVKPAESSDISFSPTPEGSGQEVKGSNGHPHPRPLSPQAGEGRVSFNFSPRRGRPLTAPLEGEGRISFNFSPRPLGGEGGAERRVRGFINTSKTYERTLRLPVPMRDPTILLKLLQLNLGAHPPHAPIRKITITTEPAKPRFMQGGLFAPLSPDPEKLEVTLARIGALIGAGNLGSPELLDTHRPSAFRMCKFNPLSAGVASAKQRKTLSASRESNSITPSPLAPLPQGGEGKLNLRSWPENRQYAEGRMQKVEGSPSFPHSSTLCPKQREGIFLNSLPSPRGRGWRVAPGEGAFHHSVNTAKKNPPAALRIFRPPLTAQVELREGVPVRVFFSGITGDVISIAGPWRSTGDWWLEESWQQDEWDVEIKMRSRFDRQKARPSLPQRLHQDSQEEQPAQESALYRIYRDASIGNWFVRGSYD